MYSGQRTDTPWGCKINKGRDYYEKNGNGICNFWGHNQWDVVYDELEGTNPEQSALIRA